MFSKAEVQQALNQHRHEWGRSDRGERRNLWSVSPTDVAETDAILAGIRHSCMVIADVSTKKTPYEMFLSYGGKNQFFEKISDLFLTNCRLDLSVSWNKREIKSRREKTYPEVKAIAQYPDGHHKRTLAANSRMVQYYVPDHFKTLDLISHGLLPKFASTPEEQKNFKVDLSDYSVCAVKANNLDHFCALTAVRTAKTLHDRGVDTKIIAKLLAQNFAQTGTIREQGQIKHAQHIVDLTIQEIVAAGSLPGLAQEFREFARPKVTKFYQGKRNPDLKIISSG